MRTPASRRRARAAVPLRRRPLGVEPRLAPPPQASDIALRAPRVAPPAALAGVLTQEPYERLLHTYGKSYPETVRAFAPRLRQRARSRRPAEDRSRHRGRARLGERREGRGHSVRRRLLGRRRRRARRSATAIPARSASTCAISTGCSRSTRRAAPRASRAGFAGRRSRRRFKPHGLAIAPLSAELRVLDPRRLDRDPLRRPLRHALHPYRRFRRKHPHDHARRRDGVAPPAGLRAPARAPTG